MESRELHAIRTTEIQSHASSRNSEEKKARDDLRSLQEAHTGEDDVELGIPENEGVPWFSWYKT